MPASNRRPLYDDADAPQSSDIKLHQLPPETATVSQQLSPASTPAAAAFAAPQASFKQPCTLKGASSALYAGALGYFLGVVPATIKFKARQWGMIHTQGLASAQQLAMMSGMYTAVHCICQRIRMVEDGWNRGIAGCSTGGQKATAGKAAAALHVLHAYLEVSNTAQCSCAHHAHSFCAEQNAASMRSSFALRLFYVQGSSSALLIAVQCGPQHSQQCLAHAAFPPTSSLHFPTCCHTALLQALCWGGVMAPGQLCSPALALDSSQHSSIWEGASKQQRRACYSRCSTPSRCSSSSSSARSQHTCRRAWSSSAGAQVRRRLQDCLSLRSCSRY